MRAQSNSCLYNCFSSQSLPYFSLYIFLISLLIGVDWPKSEPRRVYRDRGEIACKIRKSYETIKGSGSPHATAFNNTSVELWHREIVPWAQLAPAKYRFFFLERVCIMLFLVYNRFTDRFTVSSNTFACSVYRAAHSKQR